MNLVHICVLFSGALYKLRSHLFNERRGDRSGSPDIAVFIVDGPSDVDEDVTEPEAVIVKDLGIEVYVIGVGHRVSDTLQYII